MGSHINEADTDDPGIAAIGHGNLVRSAHFTVVAPNGQVLSVGASAEVNDPAAAGDRVFGVTAVGP